MNHQGILYIKKLFFVKREKQTSEGLGLRTAPTCKPRCVRGQPDWLVYGGYSRAGNLGDPRLGISVSIKNCPHARLLQLHRARGAGQGTVAPPRLLPHPCVDGGSRLGRWEALLPLPGRGAAVSALPAWPASELPSVHVGSAWRSAPPPCKFLAGGDKRVSLVNSWLGRCAQTPGPCPCRSPTGDVPHG